VIWAVHSESIKEMPERGRDKEIYPDVRRKKIEREKRIFIITRSERADSALTCRKRKGEERKGGIDESGEKGKKIRDSLKHGSRQDEQNDFWEGGTGKIATCGTKKGRLHDH